MVKKVSYNMGRGWNKNKKCVMCIMRIRCDELHIIWEYGTMGWGG